MATSDADPWESYLSSLPPELRALYDGSPPDDAMVVAGGQSVHVVEFLTVLAEQVSTPSDAAQRRIRHDRQGAGMLAEAWHHIVFGQARAVLTLVGAALQMEAQANARVCFEHAVALQELAVAADNGELEALLEQVVEEARKRQTRQLDYLDAVDASTGGTHRSMLDAVRRDHETWLQHDRSRRRPSPRIKAMFEQVSPGGHLHSVYGRLSESSTHAGLGSAAPYLGRALRVGAAVPATPEVVDWAETAAMLCWSCWAADDAMRRLLEGGTDRADRHVEPLARVGLAPG
jgi:hypothetical protein